MNQNNIRSLPYYQLPKDWIIHVIDRGTNEQHLEVKDHLSLSLSPAWMYSPLASGKHDQQCSNIRF